MVISSADFLSLRAGMTKMGTTVGACNLTSSLGPSSKQPKLRLINKVESELNFQAPICNQRCRRIVGRLT